MIRVVIYLVAVGLLAAGAAWLADRPGDVTITWQGMRIETSVMVLIVAVTAVAAAAVLAWTLLRAVVRAPEVLWLYLRTRRGVRGYLAVSRGLIAIGSGDVRAARKFAEEASRIAPDEPLTLLLSAQASQLAGDREAAVRTFRIMSGRDDTRLLGLHGLFIEAQRRGDAAAALRHAEEAAQAPRPPAWAALAVFDSRCAAGDWVGALARLERNARNGLVDRATHRRLRAVLLTARALEADARDDRTAARTLALEAVKLAPTLVPAAALADSYAHLRPGDSARDRLTRVEALAATTPGNVEGALAVARAALDAREFAVARRALAPLTISPSRRVSMLMAELEEKEHGDEGRAREWMTRAVHARRDPAWTADGIVSEHWLPVSPVTGRLDAFQWKDPVAAFDAAGTVIELERGEPAPAAAPPAETAPPESQIAPPPEPAIARTAAVPIAPVIPLVRVPDDPGPDAPPPLEPETEGAPPPNDGWRRLRALFK